MSSKKELIKQIMAEYGDDTTGLLQDIKAYEKVSLKKKAIKPPTGPVIASLKDVKKTYKMGKTKVEAVRGVSFDIHQGEIVALIGPSGSGKSSVLNLIGGLDTPSEGSVVVDDNDLSSLSDTKLSKFRAGTIGFVFQFFYLQPFLDLQQNVEIPMMFKKIKRSRRGEVSGGLIDSVGLADREKHLPRELSGGQIQRTAIARSLVNNPKLVLADEPTGNLDRKNGDQVMDLFEQIRKDFNTAILIVTHDEKTAARADRIIQLDDGVVA